MTRVLLALVLLTNVAQAYEIRGTVTTRDEDGNVYESDVRLRADDDDEYARPSRLRLRRYGCEGECRE
jgi:hypothetical protein